MDGANACRRARLSGWSVCSRRSPRNTPSPGAARAREDQRRPVRGLVAMIRRELISHEKAEIRELYPVLRAHPRHARSPIITTSKRTSWSFDRRGRRARVRLTGARAAYQRLIDAVVSSCKMNTLLMDTLWNLCGKCLENSWNTQSFPQNIT